MTSTEELKICYLFGETSPSDADEETAEPKELKNKNEESKSSDKASEQPAPLKESVSTPSKEETAAVDENLTKKLTPEDLPKKGDFYRDYLDLTSLLTHMPTYKAVAPRIISLIVSDLQSKRLRRTSKDEVLSAALSNGLKCQHLTRRRFATYDLLLPTKEDCEALARKVLVYDQLRIQTEYRGRRLVRTTLFKTPGHITEEQITAFFQQYGEVVSLSSRVSRIGFPFLEWDIQIYLDREGFDSIPELFTDQGLRLPVVVEGRRPLCWNCSRMGHLSAECLNKKNVTNKRQTTQTRNSSYRGRSTARPSTKAPVSNFRSSGGLIPFTSDTNQNTVGQTNRNRPRRSRRRGRRTSLSSC